MDVTGSHTELQFDEFDLCELFLIVRPEDKAAVCRLLETEVGGDFICYHVLGRGCEGGFLYGDKEPRKWLGWFDRPLLLALMPKIMIWMVIERTRALEIVRYVGPVIRQNGMPDQHSGGFAFMAEIGQEIPVGYTKAKASIPAREPAYLV